MIAIYNNIVIRYVQQIINLAFALQWYQTAYQLFNNIISLDNIHIVTHNYVYLIKIGIQICFKLILIKIKICKKFVCNGR